MYITHLMVKNFKSIAYADIEFNPLTMLVGANASGKSNLINVFRFISNIITNGLDNAIALQGGIPYLANANLQKGTPIEISFTLDLSGERWIRPSSSKSISLSVQSIYYHFAIQPNLKGGGYHIASDYLELGLKCLKTNPAAKREVRFSPLNTNLSFIFEKKSSKSLVTYNCSIDQQNDVDEDVIKSLKEDWDAELFCRVMNTRNIENIKELMLFGISILLPGGFSQNSFIRIFDFDPNELKKSSSMASMRILEENGSNIASVLQNIIRTKENKKKLTILLKEFLPFVEGVAIENNLDKSFSYKIQESFSKSMFHANYLSDGTVSILAIVIALHFEQLSNIIILEEPERNIHPKLLSNILSSAEDVSSEKQVIITTHNPEFLKHAKIENVRLVKRDSKGYTQISAPINSEMVKCFMQNDLGLDDLFIQDMLGD